MALYISYSKKQVENRNLVLLLYIIIAKSRAVKKNSKY